MLTIRRDCECSLGCGKADYGRQERWSALLTGIAAGYAGAMAIDRHSLTTTALHADRSLEAASGIAPPIMQSVTYRADDAEDFARRATDPLYDEFYARHGNPTSSRIAKVVADLERAEAGIMFASGMAAISTVVLAHVKAGDHVVAQSNHYISTTHLMTKFLPRFGVEVTQVDQRSVDAFAAALRPSTRVIMTESPVNPTMQLTDLAGVAQLAKGRNVVTICDNTFASPFNQRPIELGIDVVCHSATKYIGGHHDLLAGCVVGTRALVERVWDTSMTLGNQPAPFNAWLALRGVRTLSLRIGQHNANAMAVAHYLSTHPKVADVHYPGLASHPQHDLARRQMAGFGGVLSFVLKGGYEAGVRFLRATELIQNAGSLGGVDSLAIQPAAMWGGRLPPEVVAEQGLAPGMVRLATGLEQTDELLADIDRGLAGI